MNEIIEQPEYELVCKLIQDLDRGEVLDKLNANCLAAGEMIQNALDSSGVRSKIVECNLLISKDAKTPYIKPIHFVGYNFIGRGPNAVDTHVVVLVEAQTPFIVDASIGYLMQEPKLVIVAPLSNRDPDILAEQVHNDYSLTYRVKKNIRLTNLHQKTLLDRVLEDQKIRKDVGVLGWLVRILIAVGVFNMIANTWLIILKFMYP